MFLSIHHHDVLLTEDGQGGRVDEGGPCPEHDPVGEVEHGDVVMVDGGQRQPECGQQRPAHGGGAETDLGKIR